MCEVPPATILSQSYPSSSPAAAWFQLNRMCVVGAGLKWGYKEVCKGSTRGVNKTKADQSWMLIGMI